jgi:hypothetical protein
VEDYYLSERLTITPIISYDRSNKSTGDYHVSNTVARGPLPITRGPFTTTEAPLVLGFDKIFLRPAVLSETDLTFNVPELSVWAAKLTIGR